MLNRKTDMGYIHFSKNVVERIIEDAVLSCDGNVHLQNFKGKYKSVIPGNEEIRIAEHSDGVLIEIYVVMKFGASISENSKKIMDYVEKNLIAVMGEKPAFIRIIVTGVKSIGIARRHMEISRRNEASDLEKQN